MGSFSCPNRGPQAELQTGIPRVQVGGAWFTPLLSSFVEGPLTCWSQISLPSMGAGA